MDKKYYYIISAIVLLLLAIGSYFAFAISATDYYISKPFNATFNSSTNTTQAFVFSYTNTTNLSADCRVYVNDVLSAQNATAKSGVNNTVYSNQSFNEGLNTVYITCVNGTTVSSQTNQFIIDTTAPTYIYADLPTDSYNTSNATVLFRVKGIDAIGNYYDSGRVNFTLWANGKNRTIVQYGNNTEIVFTETFPDGLYNWNITITDNASNSLRSSTNSLRVDTTAPVMSAYSVYTFNGTSYTNGNMTLMVNFTSIDALVLSSNPYIKIYSNSTMTNITNSTGRITSNGTGTHVAYSINLTPYDIPYDGVFVIEPHVQDVLGNDRTGTNQTNYTKTTLKRGWNLVQSQHNYSFMNLSSLSSEISKVSWWNVSSQGWETYTVGAYTNAEKSISDGEAAYLYADTEVGLIRNWSMNFGNYQNKTITTGWNTLTFFNSTIQLYHLCHPVVSYSNMTIKAVSFYDASVPIYYSQVCSIATGFNNNVTLPRGKGYWLNTNATGPMDIRR